MKGRLGIGISLLFVTALLLSAYNGKSSPRPRPSQQPHHCSAKTTVGRYFVICNGYLTPGPGAPLLPAKLLGTVTADDTGTFTGSSTVMIGGGPPVTQVVRGTEDLKEDCNGTITYDQKFVTPQGTQQGPPLNISFFVSEDGDRLDGLVVDPGTVFSCELRRIREGDRVKD